MKKLLFPSPLEVDRFISEQLMTKRSFSNGFPSPLEVYRFISEMHVLLKSSKM